MLIKKTLLTLHCINFKHFYMTDEMFLSNLEDLVAMVKSHKEILDKGQRRKQAAECRYLLNQLLRE